MNNAELITALRYCGGEEKYCKLCPSYDTCHAEVDGLKQILLAAADVLEELQQIADHYEQTTKDFWNEACEYKQRIAELEAQLPKWISTEDRLPEKMKNVFAANNRGKQWDIDKAWYNGAYFDRCGKRPLFHVTHWMPLPETPKGEQE